MLIPEPRVARESRDPILMFIGGSGETKIIRQGVYQINHFGSSAFLHDYEHYPVFHEIGCYGVCDSVEDILSKEPEIETSDRKFVITLKRVQRDITNRGKGGGWRWHKWGSYIGNQMPTTEYLDDEPEIESVFVYHIYEKV